jgi:potassium-transporting ATPase KdpC subunit
MKTILSEIKSAVLATVVLAVVCCAIYPVVVYGLAQALFPHQANGSLIETKDHKLIGSELLGQSFDADKYFHPRPSAAGPGYDAANSSGTNLGPTAQKLIDSVKAAVEEYRKENNLPVDAAVPADAVTSSSSGLDPHISVKNAMMQAARVARARGIAQDNVRELITKNTDGRSLGVFGEPGVNVLKLNLDLDGPLRQ